jgi:phosphatidylserine/phosphatidylglycerophosphate/cardiolipin synthase-like enzyme
LLKHGCERASHSKTRQKLCRINLLSIRRHRVQLGRFFNRLCYGLPLRQTLGWLGEAYYPVLSSRGPLAVQTLLSSPETGASNVRTMYYLSIVCARKSIYIANPHVVPDPVAIETLIEAKPWCGRAHHGGGRPQLASI